MLWKWDALLEMTPKHQIRSTYKLQQLYWSPFEIYPEYHHYLPPWYKAPSTLIWNKSLWTCSLESVPHRAHSQSDSLKQKKKNKILRRETSILLYIHLLKPRSLKIGLTSSTLLFALFQPLWSPRTPFLGFSFFPRFPPFSFQISTQRSLHLRGFNDGHPCNIVLLPNLPLPLCITLPHLYTENVYHSTYRVLICGLEM